MNKITKYLPLICAIGWIVLVVISFFTPETNYRWPFVASALVNIALFIAQFVVVNRNDR